MSDITHVVDGNEIALLRNGGEYFPALIAAIDAARERVWLETYIFSNDGSGRAVAEALIRAAQRGIETRIVIDGFGSFDHIGTLEDAMKAGGVVIEVFRPERQRWRFRKSRLRRLHRKLALIDKDIAFCGGINIHDDRNMRGYANPESYGARFDFAVKVSGAIVEEIDDAMDALWDALRREEGNPKNAGLRALERAGQRVRAAFRDDSGSEAQSPLSKRSPLRFVYRDNVRHRRSIEANYLVAINRAKSEVFIANAYFFPGKRMLQALNAAEARGVRVRLLLQGRREYFLQHYASRAFYDALFNNDIEIAEYCASFHHAKVAVIDSEWATVGSSNIDPFSLLLAREANVFVNDTGFASELKEALEIAWMRDSKLLERYQWERRSWSTRLKSRVAYRLARLMLAIFGYNLR
jgi:cardiolipin synthase A/B